MDITYRLAIEQDIPCMRELIALSARELSIGYYSSLQIESAVRHIFGVDSQLIVDGTYFVGVADKNYVGCGGWSKRKTLFGGDQYKAAHPDPLLDPDHDPARIRAFFVHPHWGRRGIGSSLLKLCSQEASAAGFSAFELGSTLPGVPFYTALGFQALEEQNVMLADGVVLPIIRMRKLIDP